MDDLQPDSHLTRRAAFMLAAAATPALGQSADKPIGRPVVHFEIGCAERAKSAQYFSALFGWNMQPSGPATNIDTASSTGIAGHLTSLGHEPFHYTIFYVDVEDVKASLAKAVELGGKARSDARREADAVIDEPCGFLSDADSAVNFVGTDAVLAVHNLPHRHQPIVQADRRLFENSASLQRELATVVLCAALEAVVLLKE